MYLVTLLYLLALSLFMWRTRLARSISIAIFGLGVITNLLVCYTRYYHCWPLMPMYQAPVFASAFLGLSAFLEIKKKSSSVIFLMFLASIISMMVTLFPKDFYLPFLKSRTVFSHIFMLSAALGEALFIAGGAEAAAFVLEMARDGSIACRTKLPGSLNSRVSSWDSTYIVWGFIFWTVSMFSGELWSYMGWGNPVVWDDATILMSIATWFYYIAFLHLYLLKSWNVRKKAYAAIFGSFLVFVLNVLPNIGSFRSPDLKNLIAVWGIK